jgi:hypothetical protein
MKPPRDLVVLTACADQREAIRVVLSVRSESLGIRPVRFDIRAHPRRDPGCFHEAPAVLQAYQRDSLHALVLFDREGSGQELRSSEKLEEDLRRRLRAAGWGDRADVVVIDPELEIWLWARSPHVASILGFACTTDELRERLEDQGLWPAGAIKPARPKEAVEQALRWSRQPRSPALYAELGRKVGLASCVDPSFHRLVRVLSAWFPATGGAATP